MTGSIFSSDPKSMVLCILSMCFARRMFTRSPWFPSFFFFNHPELRKTTQVDQTTSSQMETSQKLRRVSSLIPASYWRCISEKKRKKNMLRLRDSSTSTIGKRTWIMLWHSAAYLRFSFSLLMSFKIHLSADTAKSTGTKTNQRSLPLVYINNKLDNRPKQGPSFPPPKKRKKCSVILSHPLSFVGEQRQVLQNLPTPDHCYATGSIPSPRPLAGFPVLPVLSSIQHAGQQ